MLLLIHPPVAKPSEPPAGLAVLAGFLAGHGISCRIIDANLEGLYSLLADSGVSSDRWTLRARRHVADHLEFLKKADAYRYGNRDSYKRAVHDLNRVLAMAGRPWGARVSLANYLHEALSPVRSSDLIKAAERPEENPFHNYFETRLGEELEKERPSVIGLSLNYLSQALCTFALIGFIRKRFPGVMLVLGGGLITSWMRRPAWNDPFRGLVDHCVAGPGENFLLSLCGFTGQPRDIRLPDYACFPLAGYLSPGRILPYRSSSGCYWNRCSFCPERAEGNPYRPIPPASAVHDLRTLVQRDAPLLLHLVDSALSPILMKTMVQNPPGAPWYGFARITDELVEPDFCMALKKAGCAMLKLGLESGDQSVLDSLGKGFGLETASRAIKALNQANIMVYLYLLFGTPEEGEAQARKTLDFVVRHSGGIDFLNLAIFNMPVNGQKMTFWEESSFYEGDLSLYTDFRHPEGWGRSRVRQFLEKEFKRHPSVSSILRREPPVFTSNHAPLFTAEGFHEWGGR